MGHNETAPAPTNQELNEAFKNITDRLKAAMHGRLMDSTIPKNNWEALNTQLADCCTIDGVIASTIKICDLLAKAAISKHLAIIACDGTSLRAFCPACGRHYRYHNKVTGECPKNPFEGTPESDRAA